MACWAPYSIASPSAAPTDPPIKSKLIAPAVISIPLRFPFAIKTALFV